MLLLCLYCGGDIIFSFSVLFNIFFFKDDITSTKDVMFFGLVCLHVCLLTGIR